MSRNNSENESGYSLVEVLAAIVILTVAIIPMVTMFDTGLRSATTSGNYDKARALTNANLERVKSMEFTDVEAMPDPSPCPTPPAGGSVFSCSLDKSYVKMDLPSGQFVAGSNTDGMMRVEVEVTWSGKSYSATGLVAQ